MPKVSIIVPVYNVEKYIEKCLNSLLNQTLKDIEIILVNDGSTDNSKKIIQRYLIEGRILYLEKENGGLSSARNYGMLYAKGEYVGFIDSDDYAEITMYEKMYNIAKENDSDMVECDFTWKYPERDKIDVGKIYNGKKNMLTKARVVAWNKIIKREILENTEINFPEGLRYEDIEFFYKLVPYINKVSFVKEPLVNYVQRENSIANTQDERTAEIFTVLENVIKYYKEHRLYDSYKNELEYTYTRILLCSSLKRITKIKDKTIREKLLKETWDNLNCKFPNWKNNIILKNEKSLKNLYLKTVNEKTYKLYCKIL